MKGGRGSDGFWWPTTWLLWEGSGGDGQTRKEKKKKRKRVNKKREKIN